MHGLLLFTLFFAMIAFMMPFIMGFVVIVAICAAILWLLVRFGFFGRQGRTTYRRYTYTAQRTTERPRPKASRPFEEPIRVDDDGDNEVWYQSTQEGEMITLPETALKKKDEE